MTEIITKFIIAGIVIIVAGFFGWLLKVAFPWIFQNATGAYENANTLSLVNNLPLIFLGLGVFVAMIYLLVSVVAAAKTATGRGR